MHILDLGTHVTTVYDLMGTECMKAMKILSDHSAELFYIFMILAVTLITAVLTMRVITAWKVVENRNTNWMIFLGQVFLAVGIWCTAESIEYSTTDLLTWFSWSNAACYFFYGCVLLNYDYRKPPRAILAIFFCIITVCCIIGGLYCHYKRLYPHFAILLMVGLDLFGFAFGILTVNAVEKKLCAKDASSA